MSTTDQQHLIDVIARRLDAEPGVDALVAGGQSRQGPGRRLQRQSICWSWSRTARPGEVSFRLARDLVPAMAVVLANSLYGGRVLNMVTDDWARFDLDHRPARRPAAL